MASKMKKGLFRPIRYLSQMFEVREPEIQIGFPTNVRHVAHIGMDTTAEGPSWMKEYHSAPLPIGDDDGSDSAAGTTWASADMGFVGGLEDQRSSARTSSASAGPMMEESSLMSPEICPFGRSGRADLPCRAKKGRRHKKKDGVEAPTDSISGQELPAVPKKCRRRKQKESEVNKSSMGPSRLKERSTDASAAKEIDQMLLQPQAIKPLAISTCGGC